MKAACMKHLTCYFISISEGWFNHYISQQDYKPKWTAIEPVSTGMYLTFLINSISKDHIDDDGYDNNNNNNNNNNKNNNNDNDNNDK